MTTAAAPPSQGHLGLPDAAFWSDPLERVSPRALEHLEAGRALLLLDAPAAVPLTRRAGLPLVALRVASYTDQAARPLGRAVLVASDVERGRTWAARAWDEGGGGGASRPPLRGLGAAQRLVDARARLGLPWGADATLRLQLHLGAEASNPVTVRLLAARPAYDDPAVAEFLAAARAAAPAAAPPAPGPLGALFDDLPDAPPPPEAPGLLLRVPARVGPGEPALALGSFRLPVRPEERVPAPEVGARAPARGLVSRRQPQGGRRPTAVVELTLVLVGAEEPGPWLVRVRAPSYDPLPAASPLGADDTASGQFQVDLLRHAAPGPQLDQTYFVHAVAGAYASTPATMTLARRASS